jgi:formylglycine-generating enzyme required for sulfatase activity
MIASLDFNSDNVIDMLDVKTLADEWLKTQELSTDIFPRDGDGIVDFRDFAEFAKFWPVYKSMVFIPGGEFEMGSHYDIHGVVGEWLHLVNVDPFRISRYEVTNQQYCTYLNAAYCLDLIEVSPEGTVCSTGESVIYCDTRASDPNSRAIWDGTRFTPTPGRADHPMVLVSWFGASAYCDFYGFRLPTEAEWEYAARGGQHDPYYTYPWGFLDHKQANWWESGDPYETGPYPWTTPVAYYPSNGYGLYDVSGNVEEWCKDWYDYVYYLESPYDNPQGPSEGGFRVLRGGAWGTSWMRCRCAARSKDSPDSKKYYLGFRPAGNL